MFQTLKNAFKTKEVRRKLLITFALLLVYRIGCYIPVPGMEQFLASKEAGGLFGGYTFLQVMSAMTGGSLQYATFFAMGVGPYINAQIIMQLLTVAIKPLENLSKQGEEGRRKIEKYTRILTVVLAIVQSLGILLGFQDNISFQYLFGTDKKWLGFIFLILIYTAGASLTMWIGERITEYGISNGVSLLIFVGVISSFGQYTIKLFGKLGSSNTAIWNLLGFILATVFIFMAIVAVDGAERKILVQYAKQVKGRKMYGGQSTYIPMKLNASGVMPLIFAYSIISFPDLIMSLFSPNSGAYKWWKSNMGAGSWSYMVVLCVLILFFAYFYAQIQFQPDDVSRNIQSNGGFIPGIRPGKPTTDYLKKINNRITLFGAIFLAIVAFVPTIVFKAVDPTNTMTVFSATGLLIAVSCALEFQQAVDAQVMMKNYSGFLKK